MLLQMNWITALFLTIYLMIAKLRCTEANFDLILNGKPGYALNYTGIPDLGSFTLCFWMRQDYTAKYFSQNILSYANDDDPKAFTISSIGGKKSGIVFHLFDKFVFYPQVNIKDHQWHHFCFTWDNQLRFMIGYVDGEQNTTANVVHIKKGAVIKGGGCLIIGFEQTVKCSLISISSSAYGYTGMISQVNLWSVTLDPSDVKKVFRGCETYQGNVLPWNSVFLNSSMAGKNTTSPSSACQVEFVSRMYVEHSNRMLIGHTISYHTASDTIQCAQACLSHKHCRSFNYFEGQDYNNCELNNSDSNKNPQSLGHSSGVSYGACIDMLDKIQYSMP